jgi:transcriptional regulator with XRE-family HTH domain
VTIEISVEQLVAARRLLGWTRDEVAAKLARGNRLIGEAERGNGTRETRERLANLYRATGVEFLPAGQVQMKTSEAHNEAQR